MKKIFALIIALLLCLSAVAVFAGCDKTDASDDATNAPDATNTPDKPTEAAPTEPPSLTNVEVAVNSFNKIDLATFFSVSGSSFEEIKDLSAMLEMTATSSDEYTGTITAAIENGVFYVSSSEGEDYHEEYFGKIDDEYVSIFGDIDGEWALVGQATIEELLMNYTGVIVGSDNSLKDIKIPKLKAEQLTEKNGLLLVSNEYVCSLIEKNLELLYGESLPAEEIEEIMTDAETSLTEAGFELYVGTGFDEITTIAIALNPSEELTDEFKSLYVEIVLTDDAKALKAVNAEWTTDLSADDTEELKTSKLAINTVLNNGVVVGAKAIVEEYEYDYFYEWTDAPDVLEKPSEILTDTEYYLITKTTLKADLDLSKLASENGKVFSLDVDHVVVEAYEIVSEYDEENYEWHTTNVTQITDLSKFKESEGSIDASVVISGANKADISFKMLADGEEMAITGYVALNDITFPTIPDAVKELLK